MPEFPGRLWASVLERGSVFYLPTWHTQPFTVTEPPCNWRAHSHTHTLQCIVCVCPQHVVPWCPPRVPSDRSNSVRVTPFSGLGWRVGVIFYLSIDSLGQRCSLFPPVDWRFPPFYSCVVRRSTVVCRNPGITGEKGPTEGSRVPCLLYSIY